MDFREDMKSIADSLHDDSMASMATHEPRSLNVPGGARCKDHRCAAQSATALLSKLSKSSDAADTAARCLGMSRGRHVWRHFLEVCTIVPFSAGTSFISFCQVTKEEFPQKCLGKSHGKPCVTTPAPVISQRSHLLFTEEGKGCIALVSFSCIMQNCRNFSCFANSFMVSSPSMCM